MPLDRGSQEDYSEAGSEDVTTTSSVQSTPCRCKPDNDSVTSVSSSGSGPTTPTRKVPNRKSSPTRRLHHSSSLMSQAGHASGRVSVDDGSVQRTSQGFTAGSKKGPRRHSLAVVDHTGHLQVPTLFQNISGAPMEVSPQSVCRCPPPADCAAADNTPSNDTGENSPGSPNFVRTNVRKHAPMVAYCHSEDRVTTSDGVRPICPSLPYSPYSSPAGSPRLRRQPTKETRRLSITDGGGGYTQLNQYKMKDEIGKVSKQQYPHTICYVNP